MFCDTVWPATADHRDAIHRLRGRGARVRARCGKVADSVAGDGVSLRGGDDARELAGGVAAGVVVVEIGHRLPVMLALVVLELRMP